MAKRKKMGTVTPGPEDKAGTKATPDEPKPNVQPPAQEAGPPDPGKVMMLVPSVAGKSHVVTYEGGRFEMEMIDATRVEHVADFSGRECSECGMELTGAEVENSIRLTGQGENVWCPRCRARLRPTFRERFARAVTPAYQKHRLALGQSREGLEWWARLSGDLQAYLVRMGADKDCREVLLDIGGIALAAYEDAKRSADLTT